MPATTHEKICYIWNTNILFYNTMLRNHISIQYFCWSITENLIFQVYLGVQNYVYGTSSSGIDYADKYSREKGLFYYYYIYKICIQHYCVKSNPAKL